MGWTLAGNVGYAACQWAMLVVLTKMVTPYMVGQFGLGLAISVPLLMFSNLQARSLQATYASGDFQFQDYLGLRLLTTGLAFVAIAGIAFLAGHGAATTYVIISVGVAKCLESIQDTTYGQLQMVEIMNRISLSMLLKGLLSLAVLAAAVAATHNVLWGTLAMGCSTLIVLLCYDFPGVRRLRGRAGTGPVQGVEWGESLHVCPRWKRGNLLGIARLGLPLGITSLLLAAAVSIPRYLLEYWHGEAALGYYAALAHPTAAFSILLGGVGQAATPRLAEYHLRNRKRFWRTVSLLGAAAIVIVAAVAACVAALGPGVLTVLYRKDYSAHFDVFLLLLGSAGLWSIASVLGYAATASRRTASQAPAALGVCTAAAVCSLVTVRSGGLMGAATASVVAGFTAILLYAILILLPGQSLKDESWAES